MIRYARTALMGAAVAAAAGSASARAAWSAPHPAEAAVAVRAAEVAVRAAQVPQGRSASGSGRADTIPQITLGEALRRATRLDPDYVAAFRRVSDAEWVRRSALSTFILPSVRFTTSATRFSTEFFNVGIGDFTTTLVDARLEGTYSLFRGGGKFFELKRSRAEVESAEAGELEALFQTALETESDYYDVLAQGELLRVAEERVRRAEEQFAVARARVAAGAAVRTDSLQLLLELTRAQVDRLRQESSLNIARIQLGRRVGIPGPVDAVPLDTLPPPALPIGEAEAVAEALLSSPRAMGVEADDRAAEALFRSARAAYLPEVNLFGQWTAFDDSFFPTATTRAVWGVQITIPIWNDAQREVDLSRARTSREVARAARRDTELGLRRDVSEAHQVYNTARASVDLAAKGVLVARENLQVQEERYRAGATTIIDLITAQVSLAEAEAQLVQARFATRLALAGLEALLGRRLFPRE
ncbi:MAG: TolC family protein [Gemmatimonadota bacterium]